MKLSATMMLNVQSNSTQAIKDTTTLANQAERAQKASSKFSNSALRRAGILKGDGDGDDPRTNRTNRSAAGNRGAAGRNFAGLAAAAGDSSGLVASYATLAANIFALTAAFKALSDAAKFVQLQKGLELVGAQAGTTLSITSKKVEELSGFAISTVEAMKSVASATAAGFSGKEIERITKVAKGASTALGRDMSDAMDRLTRGTIKLEPELLDELGIMTRIDEAVKSYAFTHKLAASALTTTQRRQAFLNAVLIEGEQKFGAIADAVEVSAYDKLSAGMRKLGTESIALVNGALGPLLDLLIKFPALALIPMSGILSTVVGKLIPDLGVAIKGSSADFLVFADRAKQVSKDVTAFRRKNVAKDELSDNAQGRFNQITKYDRSLAIIAEDASVRSLEQQIKLIKKDNLEQTRAINLENQTMTRPISRNLELNKEIEASLKRQIVSIKKEAAFTATSAQIQIDKNAALSKSAILDKLQTDIYRSGGGLGGTLGAFGNAYAGAFGQMTRDMRLAKVEAGKINAQYGTTNTLLGAMNTASLQFRSAWASTNTIIGITGQAIQALAGKLFIAISVMSVLVSIWPMIEEYVFKTSKRARELKDELNSVTENAMKTGDEIRKFQEVGLFGKAIDSASNSMTELYNKTKEYNEELRKGRDIIEETSKYGILNKRGRDSISYIGNEFGAATEIATQQNFGQNLKTAGVKDEAIKLIGATGDLLTPFGDKLQDTFIEKVKSLTNNPDGLAAYLLEIQSRFGESRGAMQDFDAASKELSKTLIKLRTPDVFITSYSPVLDQLKAMDSSFRAILKTFDGLKSQGSDAAKAYSALGKSMASSYENIAEIARLSGDKTLFDKFAQRTEAATALFGQRQISNNEANITAAQNALDKIDESIGRVMTKSVALRAEWENSKKVLSQTALEGLKLEDSLAGLRAEGMKLNNSIKSVNKEMQLLDKTGSSEKGIFGSALAQVDSAKEAKNIAIQTASIKMAVIDAEYKLLEVERELAILAQRDKLNSPELRAANSLAQLIEKGGSDYGAFGVTAEELATAQKYREILGLLVGQEQTRKSIRDQSIANISKTTELASKQVDLEFKKLEAYSAVENRAKRNLDILKEQLDSSRAILNAEKELYNIKANLSKLAIEEKAFKNNRAVSPQETYELEKAKLGKEITFAEQEAKLILQEHDIKMDLYKNEYDINQIRLAAAMGELRTQRDRKGASVESVAEANKALAVGAAYESDLVASMARFKSASDNQRSLLDQTGTARVALATAVADAFKAPLENFLYEWGVKTNNLIDSKNRTGNTALISMADQGTANTIRDMASDPRSEGLSSKEIQKKAVAFELLNAEMTFTDNVMESIGSNASEAFKSLIDGTKTAKQAFGEMALSILQDISAMITRMLVLNLISAALGGGTGGTNVSQLANPNRTFGAAGGVIGLANGGVMNRSAGGLQGIVTKPTYVVGEGRMNEAVVPLPNGRAIPVQMHGNNTSSNNVQVNVNLSSNGEAKTETQGPDMNNLGLVIASAVQKELLAQKAPGGILSRYGAA